MGAVRYVVSLESADRKIFMSVSLLLLVGCMVIFFVVLSNTYFIRSIVKPLGKISAVARRIAQGDFKVRIRKSHDDEDVYKRQCSAIPGIFERQAAAPR